MDENKEKIQNFGDMAKAVHQLSKPWIIFCGLLLAALVATNAIWGIVHWKQLQYAYMTPEEYAQEQQFDEHSQSQRHITGAEVTNGG